MLNVSLLMMALLVAALIVGAGGVPPLALTPTPSPTPDPLELAWQGVSHNAEWEPFVQALDGVEMVLVPSGCFVMGSPQAELEAVFAACEAHLGANNCDWVWFESEAPAHQQCIVAPFWLDLTEVDNAQYARIKGEPAYSLWMEAAHPVEMITWDEARDYCALRAGRLPTEAEWEYAARGPDGWRYPWGDDFDVTRLNFCEDACAELLGRTDDDTGIHDGYGGTAPTGSYPTGAAWVGALDMAGNVWEWTSSIYSPDAYPYPYTADDGRESDAKLRRVLRGGSWFNTAFDVRTAMRRGDTPSAVFSNYGVRCVRALEAN